MILLYIFKYLVELNKYRCPLGKHAMDLRSDTLDILHGFQFLA